jgi:hypothetical protein
MGEAKRRGTAEERAAAALANSQAGFDAVETGLAPHYLFIFDRTATSRDAIAYMKRSAPDDLRARLTSSAFQLWESTAGFQFVALWGSFGSTGGLTVPTLDIDVLLEQTLPAVMARNNEIGGLCAIMPAVAPEFRPRIEQKLAELQPTKGPAQ